MDDAAKLLTDPLAYTDEPRLHAALTHLRANAPVSWVDVPSQVHSPDTPAANYNDVTFPTVLTSQVRVVMTRATGFAVGLKEIQVYNYLP